MQATVKEKTMSDSTAEKLVIAISSRALFDLVESHQVYEEQGLAAYQQYQIEHEDEPLTPGDAFELVQKLLHLNTLLDQSRVEVILLSRNSADTGLRIFNSIQHYKLDITRAAFCSGPDSDRVSACRRAPLSRRAVRLSGRDCRTSRRPPRYTRFGFHGEAIDQRRHFHQG